MSPSGCPPDVEFLADHRPRVYGHVLSMTRDRALADDLTQETFERALPRLHELEQPDAVVGWLYRIATNLVIDHARRVAKVPVPVEVGPDTQAEPRASVSVDNTTPARSAERREMSICVANQLAKLPDAYRSAVMLHDGYGLTNPEIADLLGMTVANVKIRVHRGRDRLRGSLASTCEVNSDERGELVCEQRSRPAAEQCAEGPRPHRSLLESGGSRPQLRPRIG